MQRHRLRHVKLSLKPLATGTRREKKRWIEKKIYIKEEVMYKREMCQRQWKCWKKLVDGGRLSASWQWRPTTYSRRFIALTKYVTSHTVAAYKHATESIQVNFSYHDLCTDITYLICAGCWHAAVEINIAIITYLQCIYSSLTVEESWSEWASSRASGDVFHRW